MGTDIKLRRLRAVLAVHDDGSTHKAATQLCLSQPVVTKAVAACESDLGATLFIRSSHGMSPTAAGRMFAERIRTALDILDLGQGVVQPRNQRTTLPLARLVTEVQLKALSAIIEAGGFNQGARRLGLAQPSVYRSARELESLCGVPLWRREGRGLAPTPEAVALARLSDLCFHEIATGIEELRELEGIVAGRLRIGALPLARSKWLPTALAATLSEFPAATVKVMDGPYEEQISALRHGRIDMILGALRNPPPADLHQDFVFSSSQVILVRADHPLAPGFDSEHDKLTPAQLGQLSWILPPQGTPGRSAFMGFMVFKGLPQPDRVVECSSVVTTRALLLQSDHAALLSREQVENELAAGQLKVMGPPLTGSERAIGITTRSGFRPTRLQLSFQAHLRRLAG